MNQSTGKQLILMLEAFVLYFWLLLFLLNKLLYRKLWEINAYEAISHWQRKLQQIQFPLWKKNVANFLCECVLDEISFDT